MNDSAGKTAASLAITEKRPHKPGGCVGIFFQLFDWNRRFAKKKLFPKKLLPPAHPKQAPMKFGRDDKLPKLRLIANESSGGFSNVKKNDPDQKTGMRAPGLVARLMGLESMPNVQNVSNKTSPSETGSSGGAKPASSHCGFDKEDPNFGRGSAKSELRPQKLQKIGPSERQPLSRFGAEALQFKNVLSRSRKHRPKLVSPVKSPRLSSGRNASRLIDAAARILEPGLQATNRTKCALTCSSTRHHNHKDEVMTERTLSQTPDSSRCPNYHATTAKSLNRQACKNCDSMLHFVDSGPNFDEHQLPFVSSVPNYVNPSFQGLERSKLRLAISSLDQEKERRFEKSQDQYVPPIAQARNNITIPAEAYTSRRPVNQQGHIQRHLTSQQCKAQKDVSFSISFQNQAQGQRTCSRGRDGAVLSSNLQNLQSNRVSSAANAISEGKDFVSLNRRLSSRTRPRMPVKVGNCKCDADRKPYNRQDDSLTLMRKRRSTTVNEQSDSSGFVGSTFTKQRNVRHDAITEKGMRFDVHPVNHTCSTTRHMRETHRSAGNNNNDVISFTFNSPRKQNFGSDITRNSTRKAFSGDALGSLLDQKLKELTCQEQDELAIGGTLPKQTTAMILQELIAALIDEKPTSLDDVATEYNREKLSCHSGQYLNEKITSQVKEKTASASLGHLCEIDLSPGSVLDASFSNESCLSSSLDNSPVPGPKMYPDIMDCSYDVPQLFEPVAELSDSATMLNKSRNELQLVTDLLSHVSGVLGIISFGGSGLKGTKLAHAKEVVLNAELVFRNVVLHNSNGSKGFSLSHFLSHELETLANKTWAYFVPFLSIEDTKDGDRLKEFLFDCVMEYLDSKYALYCGSGFKAWTRMPLCKTADKLIGEVVGEVRRWTRMVGKIPDKIVEWEMSHSLGKWTDFEIEAYEAGAEMGSNLLEILVDEIVIDLCKQKLLVH